MSFRTIQVLLCSLTSLRACHPIASFYVVAYESAVGDRSALVLHKTLLAKGRFKRGALGEEKFKSLSAEGSRRTAMHITGVR